MEKTLLIYGTYKLREWEGIVRIFEECGTAYEEDEHIHAFRLEDGKYDIWHFRFLKAMVTKEEETVIRRKRDRLKKIYG